LRKPLASLVILAHSGYDMCCSAAVRAYTFMKPVPSQIFNAIVPAPFGALGIRTAGDQLREVVYLPPSFDEKAADSAIAERSAQQLARYLL
ncbi:hypothetical protein, partial [Acinetobacter baumannii]|uniref:hypothetical protein n=1 Tax=Acinetobacter baumannii TaxID=470 RepID=UPI00289E59DA